MWSLDSFDDWLEFERWKSEVTDKQLIDDLNQRPFYILPVHIHKNPTLITHSSISLHWSIPIRMPRLRYADTIWYGHTIFHILFITACLQVAISQNARETNVTNWTSVAGWKIQRTEPSSAKCKELKRTSISCEYNFCCWVVLKCSLALAVVSALSFYVQNVQIQMRNRLDNLCLFDMAHYSLEWQRTAEDSKLRRRLFNCHLLLLPSFPVLCWHDDKNLVYTQGQ